MGARGGRTRPGASGRLLERERELEALAAVVGAAADGTPGLVLVEGPAGIGKSRLLAAAKTLADEGGLRVLAARSGELEREFPFGIVRQLFESMLSDESARSDMLSGAAGAAAPSPSSARPASEDATGAPAGDAPESGAESGAPAEGAVTTAEDDSAATTNDDGSGATTDDPAEGTVVVEEAAEEKAEA